MCISGSCEPFLSFGNRINNNKNNQGWLKSRPSSKSARSSHKCLSVFDIHCPLFLPPVLSLIFPEKNGINNRENSISFPGGSCHATFAKESSWDKKMYNLPIFSSEKTNKFSSFPQLG